MVQRKATAVDPRGTRSAKETKATSPAAAAAPVLAEPPKPVKARRKLMEEDMVTAVVPVPFKLTTDDHVMHDIAAGTQDLPRAWAEHDYAKAHGVTIYSDK